MTFWFIIAAMAAVVAFLLGLTMVRGRATGENPAAYDLRVYRDQLKEVEKDLARGVISPEDAARVKSEISRRVLSADAALTAGGTTVTQPRKITFAMTTLMGVVLIGGALTLYWEMGAPGYPDLGLATRLAAAQESLDNRLSQHEAEARIPPRPDLGQPAAEFTNLMKRLRQALETRPDDLQGHQLLASNEMTLGNYTAAYVAQERVMDLKGDAANGRDYAEYSNMLILAAGGYVSPEAEAALRAALARDPQDGASLYYIGLMFAQNDRPDAAFRIWRRLLEQGPEEALWIAPIRRQISDMSIRAGVEYDMPAPLIAPSSGLRGPSAQDVTNAQDMSTQDRQEMIRAMVEQLSERLASDGGSAAEWARLIGALGVLGDTDRAATVWGEAKQLFATKPKDLAVIRSAALRIGLTE